MADRLLPNWIDAYLEYSDNEEPAKIFKYWAAIGAVAACLERKCWTTIGKLTFYPNFYIVLVGPSGCRKGTALDPIYKLLSHRNIHLSADCTTIQALVKDLSESASLNVSQDGTGMESHISMTIFSKELTVFLRFDDKMHIKILTDWFDCGDEWKNRTKSSGCEMLNNIWVNMIGATTPTDIADIPKVATAGGLVGRMILVYAARKSKACPIPLLTDWHKELWSKLDRDLAVINNLRGEFIVTREFLKAYAAWYLEQESNPPYMDSVFAGYVDRRAMYIVKLSLVFSASRSNEMLIELQDLHRAISALQQAELYMSYAFSGVGDNKNIMVISQISELLETHSIITYAELMSRFKRYVNFREMADILQTLRVMKHCDIFQNDPEVGQPYIKSLLLPEDKNNVLQGNIVQLNKPEKDRL